jgi:hypothetical protein
MYNRRFDVHFKNKVILSDYRLCIYIVKTQNIKWGIKKLTFYIFLLISAGLMLGARPMGRNELLSESHSVITSLFKSIDNAKTLTYTMVYSERLDKGVMHSDSNDVKLQKSPKNVYIKTSDNTEILWPADANAAYAWVHTGTFPYLTVKLDPDGFFMRKDQHHGVQSSGYTYFESILKQAAAKADKDFDAHFLLHGQIAYNGITCYKLEVIEPEYKYEPYTVSQGENVISIAKKFLLSEYKIMQHNNLNSYGSVSEGQTIMIPNYYANEMTLYIDKATMLPVLIKVYDEKGMFEQYIFRNVKANIAFSDDEFSRKNKDYGF